MDSPSHIPYSPVAVGVGPLRKQGNLTGTPRKVRDLAAELFNFIQEWNKQQLLGMAVLSRISNTKICHSVNNDESNSIETLYPPGLQELCDELSEICNIMGRVSDDIETISMQFSALSKLEDLSQMKSKLIFSTWPINRYVEICNAMCNSYKKEAQVKLIIKENIAHCVKKENLMLYSAMWAHQPFIDEDTDLMLEALLKETGHR